MNRNFPFKVFIYNYCIIFFQLILAPTELFSANAYESGDTYFYHSDGDIFVFPVEIVDRLDSYNNFTGNNVS